MKQLYFLDSTFILTYNEPFSTKNYHCYRNKNVEFRINNGIEILIPNKNSLIHCGRVQSYDLNKNDLNQEDINNCSIEIIQRILMLKKYLNPEIINIIEKYSIFL